MSGLGFDINKRAFETDKEEPWGTRVGCRKCLFEGGRGGGCLPGKWEEGPGFTRGQPQFCLILSWFLPVPPQVWSRFLLPLLSDALNKVSSAGQIQNRCF